MTEEKQKSNGLSMSSSIKEVFAQLDRTSSVQVMPVTLEEARTDSKMMLLIRGEHSTASLIMAEIMAVVQNLHDLQEQAEASEESVIARV